jgi:hypothetical protein
MKVSGKKESMKTSLKDENEEMEDAEELWKEREQLLRSNYFIPYQGRHSENTAKAPGLFPGL